MGPATHWFTIEFLYSLLLHIFSNKCFLLRFLQHYFCNVYFIHIFQFHANKQKLQDIQKLIKREEHRQRGRLADQVQQYDQWLHDFLEQVAGEVADFIEAFVCFECIVYLTKYDAKYRQDQVRHIVGHGALGEPLEIDCVDVGGSVEMRYEEEWCLECLVFLGELNVTLDVEPEERKF